MRNCDLKKSDSLVNGRIEMSTPASSANDVRRTAFIKSRKWSRSAALHGAAIATTTAIVMRMDGSTRRGTANVTGREMAALQLAPYVCQTAHDRTSRPEPRNPP